MKKYIVTLVRICASVAALGMCAPAQAEMGQSSIGPSLAIGGGTTSVGIDSKFGVSDNISVRPFIYFPNGGTDFGTALTYDFKLPNIGNNAKITPFVGGSVDVNTGGNTSLTTVSFTGGADFDVTDSVRLKAGLVVPLNTDQGQTTAVTLGAGFRF
jgi:hypothetical protein